MGSPVPLLGTDSGGCFPLGRVSDYRCLSPSAAPVPAWIDHMPESGGVGIRGSPAGAHSLQL